jgi:hypothetical protein
VMFFLTKLGDILKFVTAFTIGHSITLDATLLGIKANHYLVDAVIATSVIYKGFDNLDGFRKDIGVRPPNALAMVFGFGLIHGFGLRRGCRNCSFRHRVSSPGSSRSTSGVELGQVAALLGMVWALSLVREDASDIGPFTRVAKAA